MNQIEQRTMKKVFRRLVPFLMFCYFFNFLDRVNVSFAALDMNKDLGFSAQCSDSAPGSSSSPICCARHRQMFC